MLAVALPHDGFFWLWTLPKSGADAWGLALPLGVVREQVRGLGCELLLVWLAQECSSVQKAKVPQCGR